MSDKKGYSPVTSSRTLSIGSLSVLCVCLMCFEIMACLTTPDNRFELLAVVAGSLIPLSSVPVGMEPVSVVTRSNTELWVVNHLSDSVSIVDLSSTPFRVTRTLLVGEEPQDIVFARTEDGGQAVECAFITTAHRGQQRVDPSIAAVPGAGDPQLITPGVGRADVWVFDTANLGATVGGTPK
jgi:YVTN family beta-propeller protein